MRGYGWSFRRIAVQWLALAAVLTACAGFAFGVTDDQKRNWPALSGVPGPGGYQYDVTSCLVTFYVQKDSSDIQVNLDVTYNNWAGKKSAGFRWLGNYDVTDYTCFDGTGKQLETYVAGEQSKTLVWYFPEFEAGTQRIVAKYTVKGDLKKDGDLNTLSAPWAGVWRIPVHLLRCEVVFPEGTEPLVQAISPQAYGYKKEQRDGTWVVTQEQEPETVSAFSLAYRLAAPALPAEKPATPEVAPTPADSQIETPADDPGDPGVVYPGSDYPEESSSLQGLLDALQSLINALAGGFGL